METININIEGRIYAVDKSLTVLEAARSVDAKLTLANGEGLLGVGVWNVTKWFPQLWFVLNVLYEIDRG